MLMLARVEQKRIDMWLKSGKDPNFWKDFYAKKYAPKSAQQSANRTDTQKKRKTTVAFGLTQERNNKDYNSWYLDSACTSHITHCKDALFDITDTSHFVTGHLVKPKVLQKRES